MKTGQISDIVSLELSTFVKTRKKEGIAVGKQILIVEDNELNREIALEILGEYGFTALKSKFISH